MSELLDYLKTHDEAFRSPARLSSLYSDFRYQRQSNPDGYTANVNVWLRALSSAANAGFLPADNASSQSDRLVLRSGETLARALTTSDLGRPLALGAVLHEAVQHRRLVRLNTFLNPKWSLQSKGWIPSVSQMLAWGLKQLGATGGEDSEHLRDEQFVLVGNVEAAATSVLNAASRTATSHTSRIFSRDLFSSTFAAAIGVDALGRSDLNVLLTYLSRDRAALSYSPSTGTIKLKAPGEARPSSISDEDVAIASLRTLIASMEPQIQRLSARVVELDRNARVAVSNKQLNAAKTALRSKKLIETTLQQRTANMAQLEEIYARIEQAADQVEIVRVIESSSKTLKSLNAQTGGVERVQDVVEELREQMMDVDEIGQAINDASAGAGAVDEGEVEDELEALETAERQKVQESERKEKEKRDEAEAEATLAKLAELDQMGEKLKTQEAVTPPNEALRIFTERSSEQNDSREERQPESNA